MKRLEDVRHALGTYRGRLTAGILVSYLLLTLFIGWATIYRSHGPRLYVASRKLPRNHSIRASDLKVPPEIDGTWRELILPDRTFLTGRYLLRPLAEGAAVDPSDTNAEPQLKRIAGLRIVPVAVAGQLPHILDAGDTVDVLANGRRVARDAAVEAMSCSPQCVALISVPAEAATEIVAKGAAATAVPAGPPGGNMEKKSWTAVTTLVVPANAVGSWTLAIDFVPAQTTLKLEAKGTWTCGYSGKTALTCGPDGRPELQDAALLMPDAPNGALIAKLGGSTAGKADGERFVIGTSAVIATGEKSGPLYLTMNANPAARPATNDNLTVTISEAKR